MDFPFWKREGGRERAQEIFEFKAVPLWETHERTVIVVLIVTTEILVVTIETLIARSGLRGHGVSLESEGDR